MIDIQKAAYLTLSFPTTFCSVTWRQLLQIQDGANRTSTDASPRSLRSAVFVLLSEPQVILSMFRSRPLFPQNMYICAVISITKAAGPCASSFGLMSLLLMCSRVAPGVRNTDERDIRFGCSSLANARLSLTVAACDYRRINSGHTVFQRRPRPLRSRLTSQPPSPQNKISTLMSASLGCHTSQA